MTTTATDIASYINSQSKWGFDNTKLQKLVYFANAWALGWTSRPLTTDRFQAWVNGPVEKELWKLQRYGTVPAYRGQLSDEARAIVDSVVAHYGDIPTAQLIELSHEAAWSEARGDLPPKASSSTPLNASSIRTFYGHKALEGEGPKRVARVEEADSIHVAETARAVSARWKEALDILASR